MLYTERAIVLGLLQLFLPLMILTLVSAMENIPHDLEEAAASLGAGRIKRFFKIVVPLSADGLVLGGTLVFTGCITAYVTPAILGGTRVLTLLHPAASRIDGDDELGRRYGNRGVDDRDHAGGARGTTRHPAAHGLKEYTVHESRFFAWALGVVLLFLLGPFVVILVASFGSEAIMTFPPEGFSAEWYGRVLSIASFRDAFYHQPGGSAGSHAHRADPRLSGGLCDRAL